MSLIKTSFAFALALLIVYSFRVQPAAAQLSVGIRVGRPGPDYLWVGGFWSTGPHRTYTRAHWEKPPYERARWHQGRWYRPEEHWANDNRRSHAEPRMKGPGKSDHEGRHDNRGGHGNGKGHDKH